VRPRTPATSGCIFLKSGVFDVFSISITFSAIEFNISVSKQNWYLINSRRVSKGPHYQCSVSLCPFDEFLLDCIMDRGFFSGHEPRAHVDSRSIDGLIEVDDTLGRRGRVLQLNPCHPRNLHWQCTEAEASWLPKQGGSNQSHHPRRGVQHIRNHRWRESQSLISERK